MCRSQWPRGLRRRPAAARLLRSWVRIPPEGMDVCLLWVLCVVRYRSLRRADHSSRGVLLTVVCRVWSRMRRPWPALGRSATAKKKKNIYIYIYKILTNSVNYMRSHKVHTFCTCTDFIKAWRWLNVQPEHVAMTWCKHILSNYIQLCLRRC